MSQKQDRGQQQKGSEEKPGSQTEKQKNAEEVANNQTSEGDMPPAEEGQLKNRKGSGRWGRLPKTVIQKMYDNGRRKLPEKYRILLEDYFRKLPESN